MWHIYALIDPRSARVRYVGYSSDVTARLRSHLDTAIYDRRSYPVSRWIRKLLSAGFKPALRILEAGSGEWQERERHWIAHWRQENPDLLNIMGGGETRTEIDRLKMSERLKTRYFSPEHRRRISEAKTGKPRKDRAVIVARCHEMAARNRGRKMNLSAAERQRRREAALKIRGLRWA